MTHSAAEVFTMQLARAAGKTATRFLHKRGLQKADRDDVIAAAMLWCWENRASYSLTTTLETWFMNAVRDAYKNRSRAELRASEESLDMISVSGDTTFDTVAAESAADALMKALTPADREVASLTMQGYTRKEIIKKGISKRTVDEAHQRIKQLRRLIPEKTARLAMSRINGVTESNGITPRSPDPDKFHYEKSSMDVEIERLDFAPHAGKDCPPCWRCMWFEGFMPAGKRDTRMNIAEKEVRDAVKATEARKIKIAGSVRYGGWRQLTLT